MNIKKIMVLYVVVMLFSTNIFARSNGTTSAAFLKFGVGAKAAGLGDAFTAGEPDGTSGFWNIGALAYNKNKSELTFTFYNLYQDLSHNYVSYIRKLNEKSYFSAEISYLSFGDLEGYQFFSATDYRAKSTGDFSAKDYYIALGYSRKLEDYLNKNISAGVNLKVVKSKIEEYSASAIAVDLGTYYKYTDDLQFGLTIKNLGTKLKYESKKEDLPLVFSFGVNFVVFDGFKVISDLNFPKEEDVNCRLGAEYTFNDVFSLRIGYNSENDAESGLTNYGFGLKFKTIKIDYAFLPYGDLGDSHKFSVDLKF